MKLIKLTYIAHGWNLAFCKEPLIAESVQAWKYGPVIESLYHSFKHYGNGSIPAKEAEAITPEEMAAPVRAVLEKTWEKYSPLSAVHLSSLTHQPGTPWSQVWAEGKATRWTVIPDDRIQDFYERKLKTPAETGIGH